AEHGVRPDALIPDLLALPVPAQGRFSALIDGDEVLVRTSRASGFRCLRADLPAYLLLADSERSHGLDLAVARDAQFDPSTLERPVELRHGFDSTLAALLQTLQAGDSIDLLQGP